MTSVLSLSLAAVTAMPILGLSNVFYNIQNLGKLRNLVMLNDIFNVKLRLPV